MIAATSGTPRVRPAPSPRHGACWQRPRSGDRAAQIAHALAHPARIEVVRCLLEQGPLTSGDVALGSGLAQSTVSEHLRVLRDAGIVVAQRDGSRVWNSLVPAHLSDALNALCAVAEECSLQGS